MRKILVIPSWYAADEQSSKGSFFREQTALMSEGYDVKILCFEKKWVSWRRGVLKKWTEKSAQLQDHPVKPPQASYLYYRFVNRFSQKRNEDLMYFDIENAFQQYIDQFGKPDLIHAHCTFFGGIYAHFLAKKFNIPYIITEHYGPFMLSEFENRYHLDIKRALESANRVLAVSQHQKQHILMNRINCNPIVVGNLVDDKLFHKVESHTRSETIKLFFAAFYPSFIKDTQLFFDVLHQLKTMNIQFEATIIGGKSGSEFGESYYKDMIEKGDLQDCCTVIPEASRSEMITLLSQADIYVCTSISETFGITICEALLLGTPYVSTKNGGISDYHSHEFGELVELRDPLAFARAIESVSFRLEKFPREKMRDAIVDKFGRSSFYKRIDGIYQSVLKENR